MSDTGRPTLSGVLDEMEHLSGGADRQITVEEIIDCLGKHSFASTILAFSLISTSPASGIPGITAFIGLVVLFLVVQMIFGRDSLWLPGFVMRRDIAAKKLREGARWPFMEVVPTSGSIASAMIAIFAAGYLMRDGRVVILSMILMSLLPVGVAWFFLGR